MLHARVQADLKVALAAQSQAACLWSAWESPSTQKVVQGAGVPASLLSSQGCCEGSIKMSSKNRPYITPARRGAL